jgi:3-oxoacyl-[acyl-carrier-protein] synthase II
MLKEPIYIHAISSISALGNNENQVWENYKIGKPLFSSFLKDNSFLVSKLSNDIQNALEQLKTKDSKYKNLDKSVLMAIFVSEEVKQKSEINATNWGINFGSSRGATTLLEQYFEVFLQNQTVPVHTSPATTLGNVSSWVAHHLQSNGPEISHSITCSTGLHAILNGIAWLQANMSTSFLVGATEAPLTNFTLAQMKALKVYSNYTDAFPCKTLDFTKKHNSMVLGEAAAAMLLSKKKSHSIAKIIGIGYATEVLSSGTSISTDALCFQKSMQMAISNNNAQDIDAIVMHAPGTMAGDQNEYNAIKSIFGNKMPSLTSNKFIVGHTFAASGLLSIEMAILMLQNQQFIPTPFYKNKPNKPLEKILINAVGFGGNAVSILISL